VLCDQVALRPDDAYGDKGGVRQAAAGEGVCAPSQWTAFWPTVEAPGDRNVAIGIARILRARKIKAIAQWDSRRGYTPAATSALPPCSFARGKG
jgi:hypothetical protein